MKKTFIFLYSVATAAGSLGFLQATLEPHLRDFNLSPIMIGLMFVLNETGFIISSPLSGYVCDRKPAKAVMFCGATFIFTSFFIIGPMPFLPFQKSLGLISGALVLQGKEK